MKTSVLQDINYFQIFILFLQTGFVAFLILILFRFRNIFGLGILYAILGLFQFMQVFLSSTVYVEITNGILVSPGSAIIFVGSLFAFLIIYIKESVQEIRKVILVLIFANVAMIALFQTFIWNTIQISSFDPFKVSSEFFKTNVWVYSVGTILMFLDIVLITFLFQLLSKFIKYLFLKVFITMLIVISLDTLAFFTVAFWNVENTGEMILSGIISKGATSIIYSILFSFYLIYFDKDKILNSIPFRDIFYSQKYLITLRRLNREKKEVEKAIMLTENRYKTLTKISPVGIFLTRPDGYTIYVNPRWSKISGMSEEEALGDGWLKAVHPDDKDRIRQNWEEATQKNIESYAEYRFVRPDGTISWVLGRAVPEYGPEKEIIGYAGTITEITKIKLYELELNQLREKAEESDRLKSAFLANMSHEIRTPMNGIMGFAELLEEQNLTIDQHNEYLKIIKDSGLRMLNIINDIIDISKIESGQIEVQNDHFNLNELMDYYYDFYIPEANKKDMKLSMSYDLHNENANIITDKNKLSSIISNLLKNALKYSNEGSIECRYSIKYNKAHQIIEFSVKDTGIGIKEEKQKYIFDRFTQADVASNRVNEGAGLGLSISKAFVEALGGTIDLESEFGKGSNFYFTIPFHPDTNNRN